MTYRRWISVRFAALRRSLVSPSVKQKEAYARYCHTLSAAAVIGAMTLLFSGTPWTTSGAVRGATLLVISVLLLLSGTLLNEEA